MSAARAKPGAISLSMASHLLVMLPSKRRRPVRFPPGRARLVTKPEPIGSETLTNTIGMVAALPLERSGDRRRIGQDHVRLQVEQNLRERLVPIGDSGREAIVDADIAALRPS